MTIIRVNKMRLKLIYILLMLASLAMPAVADEVETEVVFPDPNLEDAVRDTIDKPEGPIYAADLEQIDRLGANKSNIRDLTGLEYCNHLQELWLRRNYITDVSPLAGLTNLENLYLGGNQITDVSPLAGLTNLLKLDLDDNQLTDVSPLAGLTKLQYLDLDDHQDDNQLTDYLSAGWPH